MARRGLDVAATKLARVSEISSSPVRFLHSQSCSFWFLRQLDVMKGVWETMVDPLNSKFKH
jgi:hypothetical protein